MKSYAFFLIVFILALITSCKDTSTNTQETFHVHIYLEREYINFAWGYVHHGWFIDTTGSIMTYDIAKTGTRWIDTNISGYYTEEEIWEKIHHLDTMRGMVPADTLEYLQRLALASVGGTNSDTVRIGADMGSYVYSCYLYDQDSTAFKKVELRVYGDFSYHNTLQSAITLSDWMAQR